MELAKQIVDGLCSFGGRWPGTNTEREAADYLKEKLDEIGRVAQVEPTRIRPEFSLAHAITVALAVAGSILSVYYPPAGVILILFAAISLYGDLTTRFYLIRCLLPSRASQNVTSYEHDSEKPARIVLTAHYDSAKTSLMLNDASVRRTAWINRRLKLGVGPYTPIFIAILALIVLTTIRLTGDVGMVVTAFQFVATIVLMISFVIFLDIALAEAVPGANDNATGVAAVVELAQRFEGKLPNSDLWVALVGAEEGIMVGMRAWIKQHREELKDKPTYFINIDTLGYGIPRYITKEGFIFYFDFDRSLIELCQEASKKIKALPYKNRAGTDGLVPTLAGFPSISIIGLDEKDFLPNYHQQSDTYENVDFDAVDTAIEFCQDVVERLDQKVGKEL